MASSPTFGLIIPSRPVITNPEIISATQIAFSFSSTPSFSHIIVFLVPGVALPEGTLASIYLQLPGFDSFRFLGAIGNDKQSAIFKVSGASKAQGTGASDLSNGGVMMEEEMSDVDATTIAADSIPSQVPTGNVVLGISIEPAEAVTAQLTALRSQKSAPSTALVLNNGSQQRPSQVSTKVLAQRIIKNAFNFLASFAAPAGAGGEEVVSMKSFQEWWSKFERRIDNDPTFLERGDEN